MELRVVEILEVAGANEYLPQFALNRISIETLMQMTDDDLARVCLSTIYVDFLLLYTALLVIICRLH